MENLTIITQSTENLNHNHRFWLGCQFWLRKENEQLLNDKESYRKVYILVQLTVLVPI